MPGAHGTLPRRKAAAARPQRAAPKARYKEGNGKEGAGVQASGARRGGGQRAAAMPRAGGCRQAPRGKGTARCAWLPIRKTRGRQGRANGAGSDAAKARLGTHNTRQTHMGQGNTSKSNGV